VELYIGWEFVYTTSDTTQTAFSGFGKSLDEKVEILVQSE